MAAKFSDPGWWQHRPRPEQAESPTKLVLGTLLPAVAVVAVVVVVVLQASHHSAAGTGDRSVAAFEVCLTAHGVTAQTKSGSARQQKALDDCRGMLPAGTRISNFGPGEQPQAQLAECMRDAGPGRSRGFDRGGPSSSFLTALAACRSMIGVAEQSAPIAPAQTSTTPPEA